MKADELTKAFAIEIEHATPLMHTQLDDLASMDMEDDNFLSIVDDFSTQVQRMGEAAEMIGFDGLKLVCDHMLENALLVVAMPLEDRGDAIDFLKATPEKMANYLNDFENPDAVIELVSLLSNAPSPMPLDQSLKISYGLGSITQTSTMLDDEEAGRPILAMPEDVDLSIPEDVDSSLLDSFLQEAPNQAKEMVSIAQKLCADEGDLEDIATAKRIAHTLKGSSATIGIRGITSLSHHLEDLLEYFENHPDHIVPSLYNLILDAAYCFEQIIDHISGNDSCPENMLDVLQTILDTANRIDNGEDITQGSLYRDTNGSSATAKVAANSEPEKTKTPKATGSAETLRVDLERINELFRISGEVMVHGSAVETQIKTLSDITKQLSQQSVRVQKRIYELEAAVDLQSFATTGHTYNSVQPKSDFSELEMHEYNELHSATNALIEETSDTRLYVNEVNKALAELNGIHLQQQQSVSDMQYLVLGTRMTAVNTIESRLQRNIRNTCNATGKFASLSLVGGDTLIDTHVLYQLTQPLLHLLRNAVDHGIETPDDRIMSGKPENGNITLSFTRRGQQVVLVCQDDGKGLDHQAIFDRAVEHGLVTSDAVMTNDEIAQLILHAGFSTKDAVSEISGRGVGMDVVNEWVKNMNGSMRVSSTAGAGTRIEMQFAASLTTVQSLIVEVNQQSYAMPYVMVQQAISRNVGSIIKIENKHIYQFEDSSYPFVLLADLLGEPVDPEKDFESYDIVIALVNNSPTALAVDELMDARDLLIKTPQRYASQVNGISGLSILGDGSLAINLDLTTLSTQLATSTPSRRSQGQTGNSTRGLMKKGAGSSVDILIVDDAISVRNSLKQLVEDIGLTPQTARDGMDAIDKIQSNKPKLVITDLEMPNLNGIELTTFIRHDDSLKELPVIMITSRSQTKHRELADKAGVSHYLTKPYGDAELIQLIQQHMKQLAHT